MIEIELMIEKEKMKIQTLTLEKVFRRKLSINHHLRKSAL